MQHRCCHPVSTMWSCALLLLSLLFLSLSGASVSAQVRLVTSADFSSSSPSLVISGASYQELRIFPFAGTGSGGDQLRSLNVTGCTIGRVEYFGGENEYSFVNILFESCTLGTFAYNTSIVRNATFVDSTLTVTGCTFSPSLIESKGLSPTNVDARTLRYALMIAAQLVARSTITVESCTVTGNVVNQTDVFVFGEYFFHELNRTVDGHPPQKNWPDGRSFIPAQYSYYEAYNSPSVAELGTGGLELFVGPQSSLIVRGNTFRLDDVKTVLMVSFRASEKLAEPPYYHDNTDILIDSNDIFVKELKLYESLVPNNYDFLAILVTGSCWSPRRQLYYAQQHWIHASRGPKTAGDRPPGALRDIRVVRNNVVVLIRGVLGWRYRGWENMTRWFVALKAVLVLGNLETGRSISVVENAFNFSYYHHHEDTANAVADFARGGHRIVYHAIAVCDYLYSPWDRRTKIVGVVNGLTNLESIDISFNAVHVDYAWTAFATTYRSFGMTDNIADTLRLSHNKFTLRFVMSLSVVAEIWIYTMPIRNVNRLDLSWNNITALLFTDVLDPAKNIKVSFFYQSAFQGAIGAICTGSSVAPDDVKELANKGCTENISLITMSHNCAKMFFNKSGVGVVYSLRSRYLGQLIVENNTVDVSLVRHDSSSDLSLTGNAKQEAQDDSVLGLRMFPDISVGSWIIRRNTVKILGFGTKRKGLLACMGTTGTEPSAMEPMPGGRLTFFDIVENECTIDRVGVSRFDSIFYGIGLVITGSLNYVSRVRFAFNRINLTNRECLVGTCSAIMVSAPALITELIDIASNNIFISNASVSERVIAFLPLSGENPDRQPPNMFAKPYPIVTVIVPVGSFFSVDSIRITDNVVRLYLSRADTSFSVIDVGGGRLFGFSETLRKDFFMCGSVACRDTPWFVNMPWPETPEGVLMNVVVARNGVTVSRFFVTATAASAPSSSSAVVAPPPPLFPSFMKGIGFISFTTGAITCVIPAVGGPFGPMLVHLTITTNFSDVRIGSLDVASNAVRITRSPLRCVVCFTMYNVRIQRVNIEDLSLDASSPRLEDTRVPMSTNLLDWTYVEDFGFLESSSSSSASPATAAAAAAAAAAGNVQILNSNITFHNDFKPCSLIPTHAPSSSTSNNDNGDANKQQHPTAAVALEINGSSIVLNCTTSVTSLTAVSNSLISSSIDPAVLASQGGDQKRSPLPMGTFTEAVSSKVVSWPCVLNRIVLGSGTMIHLPHASASLAAKQQQQQQQAHEDVEFPYPSATMSVCPSSSSSSPSVAAFVNASLFFSSWHEALQVVDAVGGGGHGSSSQQQQQSAMMMMKPQAIINCLKVNERDIFREDPARFLDVSQVDPLEMHRCGKMTPTASSTRTVSSIPNCSLFDLIVVERDANDLHQLPLSLLRRLPLKVHVKLVVQSDFDTPAPVAQRMVPITPPPAGDPQRDAFTSFVQNRFGGGGGTDGDGGSSSSASNNKNVWPADAPGAFPPQVSSPVTLVRSLTTELAVVRSVEVTGPRSMVLTLDGPTTAASSSSSSGGQQQQQQHQPFNHRGGVQVVKFGLALEGLTCLGFHNNQPLATVLNQQQQQVKKKGRGEEEYAVFSVGFHPSTVLWVSPEVRAGVEKASAGFVIAGGVVGSLLAGAGAASTGTTLVARMNRAEAMKRVMACEFSDDEPLSPMENPFGFDLGKNCGRYMRGVHASYYLVMVVASAPFFVAAFVLLRIQQKAAIKREKKRAERKLMMPISGQGSNNNKSNNNKNDEEVLSAEVFTWPRFRDELFKLAFPGRVILPYMILLSPCLSSAIAFLIDRDGCFTTSDSWLGVLFIAQTLFLFVWMTHVVFVQRPRHLWVNFVNHPEQQQEEEDSDGDVEENEAGDEDGEQGMAMDVLSSCPECPAEFKEKKQKQRRTVVDRSSGRTVPARKITARGSVFADLKYVIQSSVGWIDDSYWEMLDEPREIKEGEFKDIESDLAMFLIDGDGDDRNNATGKKNAPLVVVSNNRNSNGAQKQKSSATATRPQHRHQHHQRRLINTDPYFLTRIGEAFDPVTGPAYYYQLTELIISVLAALLEGLRPDPGTNACLFGQGAGAVLNAIPFVLCCVLKPYRKPMDNVVGYFVNGFICAQAFTMAIFVTWDISDFASLSDLLNLCVDLFSSLKALIDIFNVIIEWEPMFVIGLALLNHFFFHVVMHIFKRRRKNEQATTVLLLDRDLMDFQAEEKNEDDEMTEILDGGRRQPQLQQRNLHGGADDDDDDRDGGNGYSRSAGIAAGIVRQHSFTSSSVGSGIRRNRRCAAQSWTINDDGNLGPSAAPAEFGLLNRSPSRNSRR